MKKNNWFYIALVSLIISILSLFTSIITYALPTGRVTKYSILDFFQGERFVREVLRYYRGEVFWRIDTIAVQILALLAVAALVMSVAGICTMRAQRPRTWQFIMTVAGLVGTAIPSFLIYFAVFQSRKGFMGQIRIGIAPIIMPIAAIISIIAVTYRRNSTLKEMERQAREQRLIREADDMMDPGRGPDRPERGRQGSLDREETDGGSFWQSSPDMLDQSVRDKR